MDNYGHCVILDLRTRSPENEKINSIITHSFNWL